MSEREAAPRQQLRVLLVCRVASPFLIELKEEIRLSSRLLSLDLWIETGRIDRASHWLDGTNSTGVYSRDPELKTPSLPTSLEELCHAQKYSVIIGMVPISPKYAALLKSASRVSGALVYLWTEAPLKRSVLMSTAKTFVYKLLLSWLEPTAIFAIGHRSAYKWGKVSSCDIHIVPYFQKLPLPAPLSSGLINRPIKFVFSGQLIKRNSIAELLEALLILQSSGQADRFRFCMFGEGPLLTEVEEFISKNPQIQLELNARRPSFWADRLTPIADSDVLVTPAQYSGWGLTVPEALALGKPVVSTVNVESARYLVRDGINGFFAQPRPESIAMAMMHFIDNPSLLAEMRSQCIASAQLGSVEIGRQVLERLLCRHLKGSAATFR